MGKTGALRAAITMQLSKSGVAVWFDHAELSEDPVYPYIVYSIEELSREDGLTLCELEVDVVGRGKDTMPVETLSDSIQRNFDHWLYLDDEIEAVTYPEKRQTVPSEDKTIIRRRMTFEIRMHERR